MVKSCTCGVWNRNLTQMKSFSFLEYAGAPLSVSAGSWSFTIVCTFCKENQTNLPGGNGKTLAGPFLANFFFLKKHKPSLPLESNTVAFLPWGDSFEIAILKTIILGDKKNLHSVALRTDETLFELPNLHKWFWQKKMLPFFSYYFILRSINQRVNLVPNFDKI